MTKKKTNEGGDEAKMSPESVNIAAEKKRQLKELFPEVFKEDKIDFALLEEVLGGATESDKNDERFGLQWAGKAKCMRIIQQRSVATLKPRRDESADFDATENVFIEGDNLEALKLLQRSYFGKVKTIYIDPPYNTGKEFIYPDNYSETLDTYLEYTGQKDGDGNKFSTNTDTEGRFHSNWLNMMYPRLYLAKNLLRDDGVIFISIDDHEQANLRSLCDQIFGEENFVAQLIWKTKTAAKGVPTQNMLISNHEYVVCYRKINFSFFGNDRDASKYTNPDNDPRGPWKADNMKSTVSSRIFAITDPATGRQYKNTWAFAEKTIIKMIEENRIIFPNKSDGTPRQKKFLSDYKKESIPITSHLEDAPSEAEASESHLGDFQTETATNRLKKMFDGKKIFDFPKPVDLICRLIEQSASGNDIVLDFFAGSCTTAHAVMQLNKRDGNNRKYICVQLPEPIDKKMEAHKAGYKNIAEIGKERIHRAANKIRDENPNYQGDLGFKVFKLSPSNFKVWDGDVKKNEEALQQQLLDHIEHIDGSSSPEDILYELLLKSGELLTIKIKKIKIGGKTVFSINGDNGETLICLEDGLNEKIIDAMAKRVPKRVICLDKSFKNNDQLKANAVQTFKVRARHEGREIVFMTV